MNKTAQAKTRVLGYCRCSTAEQAGEGLSLDVQRSKILAYCDLNDLELVGMVENAGLSGKTIAKRPGIQDALARLQAGDATGLVVLKLDRLSRSTTDILHLTELFERGGWQLHSISEKLDTSSAAGRFVLTILAALAQMEREQIGERTRLALAYKVQNGDYLGAAPLGYEAKTSHGIRQLVEVETEQQALARIVELRRSGRTYEQIAAELNRSGVPTKRGGCWARATVFYILRRFGRGERGAVGVKRGCEVQETVVSLTKKLHLRTL